VRAREADDLMALKALAEWPRCGRAHRRRRDVRLCGMSAASPISAASAMPNMPTCWAASSAICTNTAGCPTTGWRGRSSGSTEPMATSTRLSKRLAYIRTWTYVAQRKGWVEDESHWRGATRAVEDRLSDALHGALTQRFVDRRTSVLLRRLKQKEALWPR
jgi:ATP-dependent RNA helicase SUPV3L1/SUV3